MTLNGMFMQGISRRSSVDRNLLHDMLPMNSHAHLFLHTKRRTVGLGPNDSDSGDELTQTP